ncbi:hypothetical protein [Brachybacterium sp. GPGPB12]|uniref:hypothetical protein n=1 Tax=Brachybacterium sp. GPGPB12 TaxID=3023517 RepID=UPI0031344A56
MAPRRTARGPPVLARSGDLSTLLATLLRRPPSWDELLRGLLARLATHRSVAVRAAVVSRDDIPLEVLEDMTDDMDAPVSFAARDRIARFAADQIEDSGTDQMGSTR